MKRKISLTLCVLVASLGLTACGNNSELEYDESTLVQASDFIIEYCESSDEATLDQIKSMSEFNLQLQLTNAGLPYTTDSFTGAIDAWEAAVDECGDYVSHGDYTVTASNDEVTLTADAVFADREATITFIYDDDLYLDSVTVDGDYTTGEVMTKAGLNTLLGMGTVFIVLIFISLLISLFKYIPALEAAFKNKGKKEEPKKTQAAPAEVAVEPVVEAEDDTELVAVIAAAIAAAEGTTTDGFVVRSIRRRPSNKWNS